MCNYFSNGKLLLTAEYVVLDGALALAIPTKYGQSLSIKPIEDSKIIWKSLDENSNVWFEDEFLIQSGMLKQVQYNNISNRLLQILNTAKDLNPNFLNTKQGFSITTKLDFPKNWGLGTSSTLINNIAQWAQIDAYALLEKTFGGSGYDIACAQNNSPITYQVLNNEMLKQPFSCAQGDMVKHDKKRTIKDINFNPSFKENLYFVYLNKKQNSRDGIKQYRQNKDTTSHSISEINRITSQILSCSSLSEFEILITQHERIIAKTINQKPIKDLLFNDFNGAVKSLGAWGGDFILVTSKNNPQGYFNTKGFETVIPYSKMV